MGHIDLKNLLVYKKALKISDKAWEIYNTLDWHTKKIIGDQFIQAVDSIGANIAEGYGRFHYLDRIKFYYNSRGSLLESKHWLDRLSERELIGEGRYKDLDSLISDLNLSLNAFIKSNYQSKDRVIA